MEVCQQDAGLGLRMPFPPEGTKLILRVRFVIRGPLSSPLKQKMEKRDKNISNIKTSYCSVDPLLLHFYYFICSQSQSRSFLSPPDSQIFLSCVVFHTSEGGTATQTLAGCIIDLVSVTVQVLNGGLPFIIPNSYTSSARLVLLSQFYRGNSSYGLSRSKPGPSIQLCKDASNSSYPCRLWEGTSSGK